MKMLLGFVGVTLGLLWLVGTMTPETPESRRRSEEFNRIYYAQQSVRARLKDPDSAQFGTAVVSYSSGKPVVCGSVNSRNGFGGYAGATNFVSAGNATFFANEVDGFSYIWGKFCR